jgi:hypothetical protein
VPYQYGYGYTGSGATNGMATAALVTGLGGIVFGLAAPVAVGLGIAALSQLRKRPGEGGRGMAIAGLVIGSVVTVGYVLLIGVLIAIGSTVDDEGDYGSPKPVSTYSAPGTYAEDLDVGDCFNDGSEDDQVHLQSCTDPHDGETIAIVTLPDGAYPGDSAIDRAADKACTPEFATYVGKSIDDSELDLSWWTPAKGAWNDGDHRVVCAAYGPDQLTATVRNSHR